MSRERGKPRKVHNVAFPVIDRDGPDQLVYVYCYVHPDKRDSPKTTHPGFAEVLFRYRGVASENDALYTFFDTSPREIHLVGHSFELAVIITDRMARYGFSEARTIVATGCLPDNDGIVGEVDASEFERKLALLLKVDLRDFLFIFPKVNFVHSVSDKLQRLKEERGAECRPIEKLDDVKFLWEARTDSAPPVRWRRWVAAGVVALAVVGFGVTAVTHIPEPCVQEDPTPQPPGLADVDKRINTAGEKGVYAALCRPLPDILGRAYIEGYQCTPSKGTLENINRVLENPTNIGFVQLDIYTDQAIKRAEEFKKLIIIRQDLPCEGLWMVTKDENLRAYSEVRDHALNIQFILPAPGSGSAATFDILQANDPGGLGRVPETAKLYVADATAVLNEVASRTKGVVGFFVQFAEPENANFELIEEKKLKVIRVPRDEIAKIWLGGESFYPSQTFKLKSGLFATKVTTACTPAAMITGSLQAFGSDANAVEKQKQMIWKIREVPIEQLLSQENRMACSKSFAG